MILAAPHPRRHHRRRRMTMTICISHSGLQRHANIEKLRVCLTIWGFVDGTIRKIARPHQFQSMVYTSFKKRHGMKFQSVVVPDGLIACLHGPVLARQHDARML
jgi:hypothetical protein